LIWADLEIGKAKTAVRIGHRFAQRVRIGLPRRDLRARDDRALLVDDASTDAGGGDVFLSGRRARERAGTECRDHNSMNSPRRHGLISPMTKGVTSLQARQHEPN